MNFKGRFNQDGDEIELSDNDLEGRDHLTEKIPPVKGSFKK